MSTLSAANDEYAQERAQELRDLRAKLAEAERERDEARRLLDDPKSKWVEKGVAEERVRGVIAALEATRAERDEVRATYVNYRDDAEECIEAAEQDAARLAHVLAEIHRLRDDLRPYLTSIYLADVCAALAAHESRIGTTPPEPQCTCSPEGIVDGYHRVGCFIVQRTK